MQWTPAVHGQDCSGSAQGNRALMGTGMVGRVGDGVADRSHIPAGARDCVAGGRGEGRGENRQNEKLVHGRGFPAPAWRICGVAEADWWRSDWVGMAQAQEHLAGVLTFEETAEHGGEGGDVAVDDVLGRPKSAVL